MPEQGAVGPQAVPVTMPEEMPEDRPEDRPEDLPEPQGLEVLADERLTVMGLFAETFTGLAARGAAQLAQHGLSSVEFEVMVRLARSPMGLLRMTDLAAQTSLTTSGVTRVVDRLVDRGLVARQACERDRRITYAVISDAGRRLLVAALPGHLELIETWLVGPLRGGDDPAGQMESFVAALRRLRDHVVPCATAGSEGPAVVVTT